MDPIVEDIEPVGPASLESLLWLFFALLPLGSTWEYLCVVGREILERDRRIFGYWFPLLLA
jgi:hypothetical protein